MRIALGTPSPEDSPEDSPKRNVVNNAGSRFTGRGCVVDVERTRVLSNARMWIQIHASAIWRWRDLRERADN